MNEIAQERTAQINQQSVDRSNMFYWQTNRPMTMEECAIIFGQSRKDVSDAELGSAILKALNQTDDYQGLEVDRVEGGEQYSFGSVNINRNFVLSDGREVVGRFHPRGIKNGYFSVEAAVARLAATHGVPVARPVTVRYAQNDGEMDLVVFEKVPSANMKEWIENHPEDEAGLLYAVGATMARIHQIPVDGYGFFDNELARRNGKLKGIHTSYRDHVLAALPEDLNEIVGAGYVTPDKAKRITRLLKESTLIDCQDPRLIHNDLADWNTIVDGRKVTAAIDWDEAHAGDPVADIACWSLFFPRPRLEQLLKGYESVSTLPDDFDEKLHVYRLRYLVSKLALRHKKYFYNQTEFMKEAIRIGLQALADESGHFGLDEA